MSEESKIAEVVVNRRSRGRIFIGLELNKLSKNFEALENSVR